MKGLRLTFAVFAVCSCNEPVTFDRGAPNASGGSPGSHDVDAGGARSGAGGANHPDAGGSTRPMAMPRSAGGAAPSDDTRPPGQGGTPADDVDASPNGRRAAGDAGSDRCRTSTDCPPGNACDPTGQCIDTCLNGAPCPTATPYCDARGVCVRCTQNSQCASSPVGHVCNSANGECVECVSSTQCLHTLPRCDAATNTCVPCTSNADCASQHEWPICSSSGACIDN